MKAIICTDAKGGIGKDGTIPWDVPEDMAYFKETTMGDAVVTGNATWKSMKGQPLKGRTNIVIASEYYFPDHFLADAVITNDFIYLHDHSGTPHKVPNDLRLEREQMGSVECEDRKSHLLTKTVELTVAMLRGRCKFTDVWVIGGTTIYEQLSPLITELHHTLLADTYDCDTGFNVYNLVGKNNMKLQDMKFLSDRASVAIHKVI